MRPSRAPEPTSPLRRAVLLAFTVGFAAAAPLWMIDATLSGERLFPIPVAPLLLLGLVRLLDRVAPGAAGPRGKAVSALTVASLAPPFLYASWAALEQPLFHRHRLPDGPDALLIVLGGLILTPLAVAPLATVAAVRARAAFDAALGGTATIAVFVAAILAGAAGMRSLRDPPPEGWLGSLPAQPALDRGDVVEIRRDLRSGLSLVQRGGRPPVIFSAETGDVTEISPADLASELAPPRGWLAVGAAGVLLAIATLAGGARHLRELRRLAGGREGTLAESGWIHFDDGTPSMRAPSEGLPPGPVLVHSATRGSPAVYRAHAPAGPLRVTPGTRSSALAAARAPIANASATAIAILALTAGPLLAAACRGLVF